MTDYSPKYSRRQILIGLAAGGAMIAGELWIPGQKLISIPQALGVDIHKYLWVRMGPGVDQLQVLENPTNAPGQGVWMPQSKRTAKHFRGVAQCGERVQADLRVPASYLKPPLISGGHGNVNVDVSVGRIRIVKIGDACISKQPGTLVQPDGNIVKVAVDDDIPVGALVSMDDGGRIHIADHNPSDPVMGQVVAL